LANEAAFDIGIIPKPLAFRPNQPYLPIGQDVIVEVLWLSSDDLPTAPSRLTVQPVDDLTLRPEKRSNDVFAEALAELERGPDGLVLSRHKLRIPSGLSRGSYGLLVDGRPLGVAEARRFTSPLLDGRLDADFGGQLRLVGYVFDVPSYTLSLVWQASPRAWTDYSVFLHVVDAAGNRLAGSDGQPSAPTSQWARDEVIVDERMVPLPDDLPPGDYRLVVGLYRADTGERLPVLVPLGSVINDGLVLPIDITREPVRVDD
jgi:hypothetical protein